jgi:uncharacterized membrane protein (DUF4010 family)
VERFVPADIALKLLVSLAIGLLVGFEREWSHKDLGVRTFALVSLLGMLTTLESQAFAWIGMAAVIAIVTVMNVGNLFLHREQETTTSVALVVTFVLGVLVGEGHLFTPTASAVLMTLLLALKPQLTRFAGGVTAEEVRGAVLLGLIGFVIYPVLPNRTIDPWNLFNPREAWLTVVLIAGAGFVNYVLLRMYGSRGLYYSAVFGGMVNSTAAVAALGASATEPALGPLMVAVTLLTVIAMFVRNLALVAIFSPAAGFIALWPIAAMCAFTAVFVFRQHPGREQVSPSKLSSPISIRTVGSFGVFFVLVEILGALGQRFFGNMGSVVVSFLGGLVSSASATAAAGSLAAHHQISAPTAAICAVLASIASSLVNLPVIYRAGNSAGSLRKLTLISVTASLIGLAVLMGFLRLF